MPYKSDSQRRWAHTENGEKALGGPEKVHEWDEASKGKKLPEKKMASGGPIVTNQSNEGDEFTEGTKAGVNHDLDAMKQAVSDFVEKMHQNYIQGQGDNGNLKGLQNVLTGDTTGPMPIDTDDGQFMGEINVGVTPAQKYADGGKVEDKTWLEKIADSLSGSAAGADRREIDIASHVDDPVGTSTDTAKGYADGGYTTGDEDLPDFDVNTNTSSLKMANNPASVTPQPPAPVFNPKAGLPPTPPPVAPAIASQMPTGYQPTVNPAVGQASNYIDQQKNQLNKYGPEQQLAVEQAILNRQRSPGSLVGQGLAGLGDAIMQGVARAGSSNFLGNLQNRQDKQAQMQIEGLKNAREANVQNLEMGQKLDAQDPKSPLSKLTQSSYQPLMNRLGYKDTSGMSAAQIETVAKVAAEFGGKEMERLWQQARLAVEQNMKNQELKLGAAKDIATQGVGTKLMNMIPGTTGKAAQQQLESEAGIGEGPAPLYATNAQGHMITSTDGGKKWMPVQ